MSVVAKMWWQGSDLYVEYDDGTVWSYQKAYFTDYGRIDVAASSTIVRDEQVAATYSRPRRIE